jgi:YidC/Oxa1 family membrane protein insertase
MWNAIFVDPMVNLMIWLYGLFGSSYMVSIVLVTVLIRLVTFPLTWQQQKSAAGMQTLQPELKKLQEKYKSDPETLQRKTMEMYREAGISPLGGCLPTLIQFPILIGLYEAITYSLAASPLQLINLSQHLYQRVPAWLPKATTLIPLNSRFWYMNLATPDPIYVLPILVVIITWLQQKILTPPSADAQSAAMSRSMQLTMPLFIGYISITLPSGLSVYWLVSGLIGFLQYAAMGKASLKNLFGTEDGSFSLPGLLGLPQPEDKSKGRRKSSSKRK